MIDEGKKVTDIIKRLRAVQLDKDNFPRMNSERWLPVGLAIEAAAEIERLRAIADTDTPELLEQQQEIERLRTMIEDDVVTYQKLMAEIERLRAETTAAVASIRTRVGQIDKARKPFTADSLFTIERAYSALLTAASDLEHAISLAPHEGKK